MEAERNLKLLKRFLQRSSIKWSGCQKVTFSEVKDKVTDHCPQTSISTKMISSAISDEFPDTKSVKLGKQRQLYLFGMNKVQEQGSSSTSTSSDDSALKPALKSIEELEHQNRLLQNRVDEQEQQHRSPVSAVTLHSPISAVTLDSKVSGLLRSDLSVFHTIEHFDGFSVDGVLAEIRSHAPAALELLNTMCQTNRHDDGTDLAQLSQLGVMMSLSSLLLKCRSIQVSSCSSLSC